MDASLVIGIVGVVTTIGGSWAAVRFRKYLDLPERTDRIEDNVRYIRDRVDNIYDALITK